MAVSWRVGALALLLAFQSAAASAACNIVNGQAYGDCTGVAVNTKASPFERVEDHKIISGVSEGAEVVRGGRLIVSGIAQEVTVRPGGHAQISGRVYRVQNEGGTVVISGIVSSLVANGGRTEIAGIVDSIAGQGAVTRKPGSVIGGVPTR